MRESFHFKKSLYECYIEVHTVYVIGVTDLPQPECTYHYYKTLDTQGIGEGVEISEEEYKSAKDSYWLSVSVL